LAEFTLIEQNAGFPGEGCKFSFIVVNRKVAITTTPLCGAYIEKEPTKKYSVFTKPKTHFRVH
jgi:hypothetical protein